MKYTIEGFSQEKLVELDLGLYEAVILRWIVDFHATGKMQKHEIGGTTYYWVSYQNLIDNLPVLNIKTTRTLARYLKKLVDSNVLMRKEIKLKYGTKVVYGFGANYESLISNIPPDKIVQCAQDKNVQSPPDKNVQSDSSINDSSIKRYNTILEKWNSKEVLQTHSEMIISTKFQKKHKKEIELYGMEHTLKAIDNYATILHSDKYWFDYKWTLWDFIARGLYKFVDEAEPFKNFRVKSEVETQKVYDEF
jgi:hypothetical protein